MKYIISIICFGVFTTGFGQRFDYELVYVDAEKIYYSIIQDEGNLFLEVKVSKAEIASYIADFSLNGHQRNRHIAQHDL